MNRVQEGNRILFLTLRGPHLSFLGTQTKSPTLTPSERNKIITVELNATTSRSGLVTIKLERASKSSTDIDFPRFNTAQRACGAYPRTRGEVKNEEQIQKIPTLVVM